METTRSLVGTVAVTVALVVATLALPAVAAGVSDGSGSDAAAANGPLEGESARAVATPAPPEPPESGVLNVTFVADDGSPVDDQTVRFTVRNASTGDVVAQNATDEGWYPVVVAPGTYDVSANAPGYEDGSASATARERTEVTLSVTLDRSTDGTPFPTATPSPTPTATPSPTPTATPSPSPTVTPTATASPTATRTESPTETASPAETPTGSPTQRTATASPAATDGASATPTDTQSETDSPTATSSDGGPGFTVLVAVAALAVVVWRRR